MKNISESQQVGRFVNSGAEEKFLNLYDEVMKLWPDSREELQLETSLGPTHVYAYGNKKGDPIVLLHGANSTSASWANYVITLGQYHRIFAIDTIGDAGRSIQKAPIQHAKDYVHWLEEVFQGLKLKEVHLVGASYGGWITLNQAIHSSELLQSITLLDPARALDGISYKTWPFMLWASIFGPDSIRRGFIRWTGAGSLPSKKQTELVISAMRDYKMQRIPPQYVSDEDLQSIKVPTLLLLGEKSPMHNSKRAASRAKNLLQDVEVKLIPKVGHQLPADIVNDFLLRFIADQKKER
ncbi:alpha/beta fold hydrolase [Gracilibacillus dipsosauri]|uniref:alpha/beta fold hydrolase n=1 Tax=Gracilibacillus dipsosauri TaxID=178340 RepID=UPI002409C9CE